MLIKALRLFFVTPFEYLLFPAVVVLSIVSLMRHGSVTGMIHDVANGVVTVAMEGCS